MAVSRRAASGSVRLSTGLSADLGCTGAAGGKGRKNSFDWPSARDAPHFWHRVAMTSFTVPQWGQGAAVRGAPQLLQNFEFGGLSCPQKPHSMGYMRLPIRFPAVYSRDPMLKQFAIVLRKNFAAA
jgi:hypothetical protein